MLHVSHELIKVLESILQQLLLSEEVCDEVLVLVQEERVLDSFSILLKPRVLQALLG